jgi:transcriptional regulator with XRE-family HTH domain
MLVGERLKAIRESKGLSQGDIEHQTGLLRCYLSRCENGHTVPSIDTLEKWARAMGIQLYQIFFEANGSKKPQDLNLPASPAMTLDRKDAAIASRLGGYLPKMKDRDKSILVEMARKMAAR